MKWRIKIQGSLLIAFLVSTLVFYRVIAPNWKSERIEECLDLIGIALLVMGSLIRVSARGFKWEFSKEGKTLVVEGPYALCRNPMYLGSLLIGVGAILMLFRWWVISVFLAGYFVIYIFQISKEEKLLASVFQDQYAAYCRTTPRLFPSPGKLLRIERYLPLKRGWWFRSEIRSLGAVMVAVIAGELLQDMSQFGSRELFEELFEFTLLFAAAGLFLYVRGWWRRRSGKANTQA